MNPNDARLISALVATLREMADRDLSYFDNFASIEVSRAQVQDARALIEVATKAVDDAGWTNLERPT